MTMRGCLMAAGLILATPALLHAQTSAEKTVLVTPDNFNRAESDMYFAETINLAGGTGKFHHYRELIPIDKQPVIRSNRDTVYSSAVFDLDAGSVTVTLPDAGKRFMSMMVIDEDHYVPAVFYGPGAHTFAKERIGTRYIIVGIRTFVDPANPKDLENVHALQDAIKVSQAGPGSFTALKWDQASQKKVHNALVALAATLPDTKRMYGPRNQVDPVRHLIGTATGWGGNPEKDALYLTVVPSKNDGATIYKVTVSDVPVDGFWSISVYNAEGYFQKNQFDAYTLNNITAVKGANGSITVQLGGCDGKIPNCMPTTPGWNYWVRLYRPRSEILNGSWTFPEAHPVQ
jgi:hypothetical protein